MYTYRNESYGDYKNPTTERISKVFPDECREFDNVIGMWETHCSWYATEERLQECIDEWVLWQDARDKYEKELDEYMKRKK